MKPSPTHKSPAGWILYDDSCGICRRWVPFWEGALRRRGFDLAPLQADWVRAKLQLSEPELLQDLRLLLPEGSVICGADVYRHATRRIWWAWPVYLFAITPGLRKVFNLGYRKFAANRHGISKACSLADRGGATKPV
jgi:predicted DCC family thiol-disulfide oxidoreductase YuxK